jgi:oxidase EvaA
MKNSHNQELVNYMFLKSALTKENIFNSTADILNWIKVKNEEVFVNIKQVSFSELAHWHFVEGKKKLVHDSGKFFSIEGLEINVNIGRKMNWSQPIINQPEIGFLGIVTKEINGVLYFLLQAKIEPGNVNYVQLSPTLQATRSNYTQIHKGKKPLYLDYFTNFTNCEILLDQLQSEQGARFLKKRNRNIIIKASDEIIVENNFCWVTLGQIIDLLKFDNIVNMDTRTVISGISFGNYNSMDLDFHFLINENLNNYYGKLIVSSITINSSLFSLDQIIQWFTSLKTKYDVNVNHVSLNDISDWKIDDYSIRNEENKYFEVIAVNVEIGNREVSTWQQPIIKPLETGICAFVIKEINSVLHFLVQAKFEPGNFDILEMAPTVQCITGNYNNQESISDLPYLDYVLNAAGNDILFDSLQSEEGGRFFREQNRNLLVKVGDDFPIETPSNYIWMTLNQIKMFIRFNNYINIQARSLLAAVPFKMEN